MKQKETRVTSFLAEFTFLLWSWISNILEGHLYIMDDLNILSDEKNNPINPVCNQPTSTIINN